jgi:Family of unknown function (DUF6494)
MDDSAISAAVSRFLRSATFGAQRELEKAIRQAIASGAIREGDVLTTGVTLTNDKLSLNVTIYNKLEL